MIEPSTVIEPTTRQSAAADRPTRPGWLALAAATLLVVAPLVVTVLALRTPRWVPVLDLAQTELRVRDVGGRHTPLVGLAGRIGTAEQQGSHPGPASFLALAPTYRALGSSAWALQVASVVVHAVAVASALWIAHRRGGPGLMAAMAVALSLLVLGYGGGPLTEPWNPYLPMLWWMVVLLGTWSAFVGDHRVLPVTVAAASFCAQTHIPYFGTCLALGAAAAAATGWHAWRGRAADRPALARFVALALGVGVLMWLPPTVDQARNEPGNYSILLDHFGSPTEDSIGPDVAWRLVQQRVDLAHLVAHVPGDPGVLIAAGDDLPRASEDRGRASLVVWAAAVVAAVVLRHRRLVLLHAVIAVGLAVAVAALSRIFGTIWFYLMLWVWGLAALMLVGIAWTAVEVVRRRAGAVAGFGTDWSRRAVLLGWVALGALAVRGIVAAPDVEQSDVELSRIVADLLPGTVTGLESYEQARSSDDPQYLVAWSDAAHIGSQGYALVNELERRGFDVGVVPAVGVTATKHRVVTEESADARVTLATGTWVERWRAVPDVRELAHVDPRTPAQQARFEELRRQVEVQLRAAGRGDLAVRVGEHLFEVAITPGLDAETQELLTEMLELGVPAAVFVGPVGAVPPQSP